MDGKICPKMKSLFLSSLVQLNTVELIGQNEKTELITVITFVHETSTHDERLKAQSGFNFTLQRK